MTTEIDTVTLARFEGERRYQSVNKVNQPDGNSWSFKFNYWSYRAFPDTSWEEPAVDIRIEDHMDNPDNPKSIVTIDGVTKEMTENNYGKDQIGELFGEKAKRQIKEIRVY